MRSLTFLMFLLILNSCNSNSNLPSSRSKDPAAKENDSVVKTDHAAINDSSEDNIPAWCDTLIMQYIKRSNSELIQINRQDTSIHIQWMLDNKDSNFLVFHLGHDVSEPDGSDLRFATDGWLYIDSIRRTMFEYDVAGDTLIPVDFNRKYDPSSFQEGDYMVNAGDGHKVYFHDRPDSVSIRKAFFNSHEKVFVEKIIAGYGYVKFINTKKQKSYGWINMEDLIRPSDQQPFK